MLRAALWRTYAMHAIPWTNTMLMPPPPHVFNLLDAASADARIARRIVNGFNNPGRMVQVPFSDRIRNLVGVPTIAVGNIVEADRVNTIIAAGRADLCALAARTSPTRPGPCTRRQSRASPTSHDRSSTWAASCNWSATSNAPPNWP